MAAGKLRCPARNTKAADRGAGYCSLIADLTLCRENEELQMVVPETLLNETELEATFLNNNAAFHKTCYDRLDVPKVQKKRSIILAKLHSSPAKTQMTLASVASDVSSICFLCDTSTYESVIKASCDSKSMYVWLLQTKMTSSCLVKYHQVTCLLKMQCITIRV